jgi:hypothetical protein
MWGVYIPLPNWDRHQTACLAGITDQRQQVPDMWGVCCALPSWSIEIRAVEFIQQLSGLLPRKYYPHSGETGYEFFIRSIDQNYEYQNKSRCTGYKKHIK